jgi:hypothetical protein
MHLARTISVTVVALGLMAQAAQAKPFGLPPGGSSTQLAPKSGTARAFVPLGLLAAQVKSRWESATQAIPLTEQQVSLNRSPLVAKLRGGIPAPPAALSAAPAVGASSPLVYPHLRMGRGVDSGSVDWAAVLGGAAIVALIGGMVAVMSRQRPHRPATA